MGLGRREFIVGAVRELPLQKDDLHLFGDVGNR